MDRLPALSGDALIEQMREECERMIRDVAAAVNAAPEGCVINGSEEQVRDRVGEFRQKVYQRALQMRVDAAEAAFPPEGPADSASSAGQGP